MATGTHANAAKVRRLGVGRALVDGAWVSGDLEVDAGAGTVVAVGCAPSGPTDRFAVPGFVDLQLNGWAGVDLSSADRAGWAEVAGAVRAHGTTAFAPTFVSAPPEAMVAALAAMPAELELAGGARVLGAHLEGPFLSPVRRGAHPASFLLDPDPALLERFLAAGRVGQMTLAPERPGGLDLIRRLVEAGVVVSLGHTDADAAEAHAAFDAGASTVTHLFNAMRPPAHRDPGVAYVALGRPGVTVQLIADGHHVSWDTVAMVWAAAGPTRRLALVTDAVHHGHPGHPPRLTDGTLAGSSLTMIEAVRNVVALGAPLDEAVLAASAVPARVARRPELGRLAPGSPADLAVLDDRLDVVTTLVAGQ